MEKYTTIETEAAKFDIGVSKPNQLEIRCADGYLEVSPHSNNMIRVTCLPWWDDPTAVRITEHLIENQDTMSDGELAEKIVNILRGRVTPYK